MAKAMQGEIIKKLIVETVGFKKACIMIGKTHAVCCLIDIGFWDYVVTSESLSHCVCSVGFFQTGERYGWLLILGAAANSIGYGEQ